MNNALMFSSATDEWETPQLACNHKHGWLTPVPVTLFARSGDIGDAVEPMPPLGARTRDGGTQVVMRCNTIGCLARKRVYVFDGRIVAQSRVYYVANEER